MTAEEYLGRAYQQQRRIEDLKMQVEVLRSAAERTGSVQYEEKVSHSLNTGAVEDSIVRLMETEEKLKKARIELVLRLADNIDMINKLENDKQRTILSRRYIGFENWTQIADNMGYSTRWVRKQHAMAIDALNRCEVSENGVL